MPHGLPECFVLIDKALHAALQFVIAIQDEEAKMYGQEGQNAGMQRAINAMVKCFDWNRLCLSAPTPEDVREFGGLSAMLRRYLRHTEWPDFEEVVRAWPNEQTLQIQYVRLCRRVREGPLSLRRRWWRTTGYNLEPIRSFPSILRLVRQVFPPAQDRAESARLARVASVLSQLLGSGFLQNALAAKSDALAAQSAPLSNHIFLCRLNTSSVVASLGKEENDSAHFDEACNVSGRMCHLMVAWQQ